MAAADPNGGQLSGDHARISRHPCHGRCCLRRRDLGRSSGPLSAVVPEQAAGLAVRRRPRDRNVRAGGDTVGSRAGAGRSDADVRGSLILPNAEGMKACPPKPGLTDMISTRSIMSITYSMAEIGVPGLSETPAFLPSALIACSERCRCGPASACTVM